MNSSCYRLTLVFSFFLALAHVSLLLAIGSASAWGAAQQPSPWSQPGRRPPFRSRGCRC